MPTASSRAQVVTVQLFEFNALYTMEADGFVIDDVLGRYNDEYGFLTFAVDHGVYKNCEGYGNGDSAIYPGSASDVNSGSGERPPLDRWAVEIKKCKSHHNTLGYSGTAGNSVYAHDNEFYANAAGAAMDSVFPDHPGLPQDHAWFKNNRIYANNENYYQRYLYSGVCDRPPAERGYENGTVCPTVLVPVGTGTLTAGGNYNLFERNDVFDNWRNGFMLFHVPAAVRNETDPDKQFDTSHYNAYKGNRLGYGPNGLTQPNGLDFWWDDQGEGNCWEGNQSATGEVTHNSLHPTATGVGLPGCPEGSYAFPEAPNAAKSSQIAACAAYDRDDPVLRKPPGCDWYETHRGRRDVRGDSSPYPDAACRARLKPGSQALQRRFHAVRTANARDPSLAGPRRSGDARQLHRGLRRVRTGLHFLR